MIQGKCPWVKPQNYHAFIVGDLYENGSLSKRNYKIYIWDKNKEQIIDEIGLPYKSERLIVLEKNKRIINITEFKIIGTHHEIAEQVASINIVRKEENKTSGILLLPIDKKELFTDADYDYFDCTSEILEKIEI